MEEQKIKVLIAEDERDIRETIADILRDEGFEVFEAGNGKIGFEMFCEVKPDVVISDIMMPEVDGYGFLKMVRENKGKSNVAPFLFLTALGQKENIIKGMNLSASDYLVKPIDFEILIAKVREKAESFMKINRAHEKGIKNIKQQISLTLTSEISYYIDYIAQSLKVLKEEPYGPYPHRKYLEDINKLYFNAVKLKTSVMNSLDENVIDSRLNADEEIFALDNFMEQAVNNFPEKIKSRVEFNKPYESEFLPKVKMDKSVLVDAIKRIVVGVLKLSANSTLSISLITDNLNQMVVIFYINCDLDLEAVQAGIDEAKIQKIVEVQSLYFKTSGQKGNINATLTLPSFRLIEAH